MFDNVKRKDLQNISPLKQRSSNLSEKADPIKEENKHLKQQIIQLKIEMKSKIEENLQRQKQEMKSIMKEYIDFIDKILVDKKQLKFSLEEAHQQIDQLQQEIYILKNSRQVRSSQSISRQDSSDEVYYQRLEEQNVQLMKELDDAKRSIKQLRRDIESNGSEHQNKRLKTLSSSIDVDIENLVKENKQLRYQVGQLTDDNRIFNEQFEVAEQKLLEVEKLLNQLENEKDIALRTIEDQEKKINDIREFYEEKVGYLNQIYRDDLEKFEEIMMEMVQAKDGNLQKFRRVLSNLRHQQSDTF